MLTHKLKSCHLLCTEYEPRVLGRHISPVCAYVFLLAMLQVVDGNRLIVTPYDLSFLKAHDHTELCKKIFDAKEIQQLRKV